jgi:aminopeptidase N
VIADVQDGMEYPMITFVGGPFPGCKGLLTHEIGHMWFYGMVGSNETYRAAMDEGFTQFFTAFVMDDLQVPKLPFALLKKYNFPYNQKFIDAYFGYMTMWRNGQDAMLNTHSSDFNEGIRHDGGYGQVYFKTATMLYNLKYVLGDSLFFKAMQHYFQQWSFCHPYPEDFRQSILTFTRVNLNWFFDQWMETTKFTDYGIVAVGRKKQQPDTLQILLKRYGAMQMPLEIALLDKKNTVYRYYIPNTWFVKQDAGLLQKQWYGWGKFNPYYLLEVAVPEQIDRVQIDPSYSLADMDMSDNLMIVKEDRLTEIALPKVLNPGREAAEEKKKRKLYELKKAPK